MCFCCDFCRSCSFVSPQFGLWDWELLPSALGVGQYFPNFESCAGCFCRWKLVFVRLRGLVHCSPPSVHCYQRSFQSRSLSESTFVRPSPPCPATSLPLLSSVCRTRCCRLDHFTSLWSPCCLRPVRRTDRPRSP